MKIYLSLFDGISCGQLALSRAGMNYQTCYASEIDKYAIAVTQHNFPNTIQLGDIQNWQDWDINWGDVDLITSGFPCQSWSVAGKQLGDKDPRGKLFWVTLDIINHVQQFNPNVHFLLENVRMKKEFENYITYHTEKKLGKTYKVLINSSLVSAQLRKRFYWSNIPEIDLPLDKNRVLGSIIESGFTDRQKSYCIDANYYKGSTLESYFKKRRRQIVFDKEVKKGWRNLTPLECERLQTLPDNYTLLGFHQGRISNTQRYKMVGNAWTVDVIAHILKKIPVPT